MKIPDNRAGFTLLELIVSLTIIAIIVVVIQNGFHIGARVWEKGESAVDRLQRYRFGLELVQGQISSAFPLLPNEHIKRTSDTVFNGDDSSLEFSSCISLVPGIPSGIVRVWYRVETEDDGGKALLFSENRFFPPPSTSVQDRPEEEEWHVILSDIKDLRFDYLPSLPPTDEADEMPFFKLIASLDNQPDGTSFWQSSWESTQQLRLPLAVRIRFEADEKSAPFYLIVPVGKAKEDDAKA